MSSVLLVLLGLSGAVRAEEAPPPTPQPGDPVIQAPPDEGPPPGFTLAGGSVGGTEDFRLRWYRADDHLPDFPDRPILDYVEAVERIDLSGGNNKLTVNLRGDAAALFLNRYILDGELNHERDLYLDGVTSPFPDALLLVEKVNVQARGAHTLWDFGDTYAAYGRGLVLNLVKNTEIDVDTSVRGVKAQVSARDWEVSLLSGVTNPQQVALENPNVGIRPDLFHTVSGARVARYGLGPVNLAAQGALFQFRESLEDTGDALESYSRPVNAASYGGSVEAVGLGGLDWYAEGAGFHYASDAIPVEAGYAAYLAATAYPGKATVLVEARRNKNAEYINTAAALNNYEISNGPTLEYDRVITEDSSAAVNSNDIVGGRVRAEFNLSRMPEGEEMTTLIPYASIAVFRDADLGSLHFNETPETILHPIAGAQFIHGETHLLVNAGYRVDRRDPGTGGADLGADRMAHADVSFDFPLAGPVSIAVDPTVMAFQWGKNPIQQTDFLDVSNALAVKIGSPWAFILYTDFSDNPLIDSTGNLSEDVYGAVEAQWKPGSATTLKLFYGAYRAGIRCAGGQCRQLPGFNGAKFSLTTTF